MPMQLPRRFYCGTQELALEHELVFRQQWLCVGHASQWEQGRSFRRVTIGNENLLVIREEENWFAVHNSCRHRGTQLCDAKSGAITQRRLVCPYHAWSYDLNGNLVTAPNMKDDPEFDPADYPLAQVEVDCWNQLVFVRLAPGAETLADTLQPLAMRLSNWKLGQLHLATELDYEIAANWKIVFQNYSECYHCPTVHPELARLTPYRSSINDLEDGAILGGPMSLAEGFETVSRGGKLVAIAMPGLTRQQSQHVYYYTVFPNLFVSAHPDYVMLHILLPVGPASTAASCMFLTVESGVSPAEIEPATNLWDEINRQDWAICEQTQIGISSPAFKPGPYSGLESMVAAFDQHYRSVMEQPTADL